MSMIGSMIGSMIRKDTSTISRRLAASAAAFALAFSISLAPAGAATRVAFFAGGCFWCTEADFEKLDGVQQVVSGFMGGTEKNPKYKKVASGLTGHKETVQVTYDDAVISYQQLLSAFWRMHDPSDAGGSFVDRGKQYGSAIYYTDKKQEALARGAKRALMEASKFDRPIATVIAPAGPFYMADAYHQDYAKRHAVRYRFYRSRSGRDQFIAKVWDGDDRIYQDRRTAAGTP